MGKFIQFPERLQRPSQRRVDELRDAFKEPFERLRLAKTFEEKQDETNNLQRIVQEYQLIILQEKNQRHLAVSSKKKNKTRREGSCFEDDKIIA